MPICHRCGKILCNEQSLRYHLNKQVSCNTTRQEKPVEKWNHDLFNILSTQSKKLTESNVMILDSQYKIQKIEKDDDCDFHSYILHGNPKYFFNHLKQPGLFMEKISCQKKFNVCFMNNKNRRLTSYKSKQHYFIVKENI